MSSLALSASPGLARRARRSLRLLRTGVTYELRKASAFRAGFLVREVARGLERVAVLTFVYFALFRSAGTHEIRGWTLPQMVQYLILVATIQKILIHERVLDVADQIFDGYITKYTVMPMRYFTLVLARWIQYTLVQLAVAVGFWCAGALLVPRWWPMPASGLALVESLVLVVLASYCFLLLTFILNSLAFWLGVVWTLLAMSRMVTSFMMGDGVPVSLYPEALQRVLAWLFPYWAMSGPIDVYLGRAGTGAFVRGLCVLVVTIVALQIVAHAIWRKGLRQYGGSGM